MTARLSGAALLAIAFAFGLPAQAQHGMTFFVTSVGSGDGANLGGLEGADAHCATLAEAAGAGGKDLACLSQRNAANAKDRIGAGPWHNSPGELIARTWKTSTATPTSSPS